MSRSSSRPARGAAAAAVLLAASLAAPAAGAAPDGPAAPVLDIVAPVLDIDLSTGDLAGAARVDEQPRRVRVTLSAGVLFDRDSARLRPVADSRLRDVAATLRRRGPGSVRVVGYTDDLGSARHGLVLSRARARAVARVLRPLLPLPGYRFDVLGKGEADPAVPNVSEAQRRLNRRVELTYRPR